MEGCDKKISKRLFTKVQISCRLLLLRRTAVQPLDAVDFLTWMSKAPGVFHGISPHYIRIRAAITVAGISTDYYKVLYLPLVLGPS